MKPIILKTGSTVPGICAARGDFEYAFAEALGVSIDRFTVVDAQRDPLPDFEGAEGIIVTGSPSTVYHREGWSEAAGEWMMGALWAGVPMLGVCYGHQLLAQAMGAKVALNPSGREIGAIEVDVLVDDPLFEGLPRRLVVAETHTDAVMEVPDGVTVIAGNAHTSIQALAYGERCRTVQFHPEVDGAHMRAFLTAREAQIDQERGPGAAAALREAMGEIPMGRKILANFARHFMGWT